MRVQRVLKALNAQPLQHALPRHLAPLLHTLALLLLLLLLLRLLLLLHLRLCCPPCCCWWCCCRRQRPQVRLRFSSRFHEQIFLPGRKFNVRFAIKRTGFVFMHEALDVAQRGLVAGARPELLLPPANAVAVPGNGVKVCIQIST
jgi:hypothetical protein